MRPKSSRCSKARWWKCSWSRSWLSLVSSPTAKANSLGRIKSNSSCSSKTATLCSLSSLDSSCCSRWAMEELGRTLFWLLSTRAILKWEWVVKVDSPTTSWRTSQSWSNLEILKIPTRTCRLSKSSSKIWCSSSSRTSISSLNRSLACQIIRVGSTMGLDSFSTRLSPSSYLKATPTTNTPTRSSKRSSPCRVANPTKVQIWPRSCWAQVHRASRTTRYPTPPQTC